MSQSNDFVQAEQVHGSSLPMALLLEADPSTSLIESYKDTPHAWCIKDQERIVAAAILQRRNAQDWELMNIAVQPSHQGHGLGAKLLSALISYVREQGGQTLYVATGTIGYPLFFYQRAGFRVVAVEPDYFLHHYDEALFEDGLQHKDRLILSLALN
ncbi:GNAT family N-acetyltransferase [Alcaligenes nematophilus]|uniref:GNAT family N-acetyltransferase n=1 Tax=Alcaligenes nematophilus TaxID=2994643 RepID=A0ABU3MUZ4_9BURK|nr:GNAT family N-acetyltransferase [Alcaligenes nematophilus]MDT8464107.1 GNAT family N-acetyltransferase [Alcaligenes nematophilus]MDT8470097.1 GNAT family N-acetyltransferase [Alcaligenes nematophilus]MDT8505564.1 GNAT family N-acetyltransferase [Alcaligenes nematophilus]MDT8525688.1 GNAT family N-acetyltransferase [Alcaligenes nematophilus]